MRRFFTVSVVFCAVFMSILGGAVWAEGCPTCVDTGSNACRRWGSGQAKFQWASGEKVSSSITLTAGPCGQCGESATGYIFSQTDTHRAICNNSQNPPCDDGLYSKGDALAIIKITGNKKAFQHAFPSGIGFMGDKRYGNDTYGYHYSLADVTQVNCEYALALEDASGSRIKVTASVAQCDPEFSGSKFTIIVKIYDVVGNEEVDDSYSLLSSTSGSITVKTNKNRDFNPMTFQPDLRDGSSLSNMKELYRAYNLEGGQSEWKINYRSQLSEGNCKRFEGWCGPMCLPVGSSCIVPESETFYRIKYPGWQDSINGQPPYAKDNGWNYDGDDNRLTYDMGNLGKIYYHCENAADGSVRVKTVERCDTGEDAGNGEIQWTVVYDELERIKYIHNASYSDPNNQPDANDLSAATVGYEYTYIDEENDPVVSYKTRSSTLGNWNEKRHWELEFDEDGQATKYTGGCSSGCSGTGSFEHVEYLPGYTDEILWQKNAAGQTILQNTYEIIEYGEYVPAGWMYIPDGGFEFQNVSAGQCETFENQDFGWNSENLTITAQICDPNLGSHQYLLLEDENPDTLYQDLSTVLSKTVYAMDVNIQAHTGETNSYATITLNAVRGIAVEELAVIDVNDFDLTDGSWVKKSVQWDSTPYSDPEGELCLIDYDDPWILQIVVTGDNVDIDDFQMSTSIWVGGQSKALVNKQERMNPAGQLVTVLEREFDQPNLKMTERQYLSSDVCRVTLYEYEDEAFANIIQKTEYYNTGTATILPTGSSYITTYGGDDPNRFFTTTSPNGKRKEVQIYGDNGNIKESYVVDLDTHVMSSRGLYEYEQMGWSEGDWKLIKQTTARGGVTEYEYYTTPELKGLLKKQIDPNTPAGRQVTEYLYDGARRVIYQTRKLDAERTSTTTYSYNPTNGYLDAMSVNGVNTQYYYNAFGQVIRQVDPDGVITGKSYGLGGELLSEFVISENTADPNGADTSLTLISQTRYTYTSNGQIELMGRYKSDEEFTYQSDMITHPSNWIVTKNEYYADGKKKKNIEDYGTGRTNLTTEYFYNYQGEIEKVLYPTGKWVKTVRDGRGLVTYEQTGYGTSTVVLETAYDYDANGNLIEQVNPDGSTLIYQYDNYDRLKRTYQDSLSGPYAERFYNEAGDLEREIACEADGTILSNQWMHYDALGNLKTERLCAEPNSIDNANDLLTQTIYDVAGNVRFVIREGLGNSDPNDILEENDIVTEYRYDNLGRRSLTIDPKGYQYSIDYTPAGRAKKMISPIHSDPNAFITENIYDPYGRLEKTINPLGDSTVNLYNSLNQVIQQTVYDCNSTIDPQDDFPVRQARTEYDNLGNIIRQAVMEDPASEDNITLGVDLVTDFVYESGTGLLYQQKTYYGTSPTTATLTYDYDDIGRRNQTVDPEGNEETITYYEFADGNPSQIKKVQQFENDPDGSNDYTLTTFFEYDTFGRLFKKILDEDGDGVKETTDPTTAYTYDGLGRLKTETANNEVVTFYDYDGFGNVKTKIDDYGTGTENRTTEFVYNRLNQQWQILAYDPNDTTTAVAVQITEYEYDQNGNVAKITYPDEKEVEYIYNLLNKVDTEIQRDGTEIYYWYDWAGHLWFESDDPEGPDSINTPALLTEFRYDAAGNLLYAWKGIDLEEVSESSFAYNGFGAKTSETAQYDDDISQTTTWTYDGSGNKLTQTHGDTTLTYTHDGLGRIKTIDRTNSQIVSYAYMGKNTESISYPEPDVVQSFGYDDLGRITGVSSVDTDSQPILDFVYDYDNVGNRESVKYNHLSTPVWDRYYYDTLNRLRKVEYAQSSGFALADDGVSLSELALIASQWLNGKCDEAEAVQIVLNSRKNPVYLSRRIEIIKQAITEAGIEDTDTLLHSVQSIQSSSFNPDEKIYSLAEMAETPKNYRSETLTNSDSEMIAQIIWDNEDRMVLFAMYPANGGTVVISTTYDKAGNTTSKLFTALDADGNIDKQVDMLAYQEQQAILANSRQALSLPASRTLDGSSMAMMSSTPEAPANSYEEFLYDHLGNRYQDTQKNGLTYTYSHNPANQYMDKQTSVLGISIEFCYTHDDNGNLETDENGNSYAYDYRNRLIEVQDPNSYTIAEYTFDALGRRIKKVAGGVTTYFFYDTNNRVIAEYEGETPAFTREFVYGNGVNEVLAMFTPYHAGNPTDWDDFVEFVETWLCDTNDTCYEPYYDHNTDDIVNLADFAYFASVWDMPSSTESNWYYLHDALGSVRGLVGGRFNREDDREFYNYDVYGKLSIQNPEESVSGNPYLYAGYRYDAETELYHTDYRTYDPETGRWLQIDPIGYADGWNLYEYVNSNPVLYTDPFGLAKSLSRKIEELLAMRLGRGLSVPLNVYNRFKQHYDLKDELNEMSEVYKGDIDTFHAKVVSQYKSALDSQIGKWKYLSFPPPTPDYSKWRPGIGGELGSLAYWLNGAHDVKAQGKVEAQKTCSGRYKIRKRNTTFEWIDEIDANSFRELEKKPAGKFEKFLEGGIGDIVGDKLLGMGFKVCITWKDAKETEEDVTAKVSQYLRKGE